MLKRKRKKIEHVDYAFGQWFILIIVSYSSQPPSTGAKWEVVNPQCQGMTSFIGRCDIKSVLIQPSLLSLFFFCLFFFRMIITNLLPCFFLLSSPRNSHRAWWFFAGECWSVQPCSTLWGGCIVICSMSAHSVQSVQCTACTSLVAYANLANTIVCNFPILLFPTCANSWRFLAQIRSESSLLASIPSFFFFFSRSAKEEKKRENKT